MIGTESGYDNTTGEKNILLGYRSVTNNSDGKQNIFIGDNAGFTNTTGDNIIAIGDSAGTNNTASNNIFIGDSVGFSMDSWVETLVETGTEGEMEGGRETTIISLFLLFGIVGHFRILG